MFAEDLHLIALTLQPIDKPVIVVNGLPRGGGMDLALVSDMPLRLRLSRRPTSTSA